MKKTDKMVASQKQKSRQLHSEVYRTIHGMIIKGEKINFYTVSKAADVSRSYLYQHRYFARLIKQFSKMESERKTAQSIHDECLQARKEYLATLKRFEELNEERDRLQEILDEKKKGY